MTPAGNVPPPGAEDPHLDAAAYALHALPPAEETAFEHHLAGCAECRRAVDGYRETAARMASAESAEVPAGLRGRVLGLVSRTAQEHAGPGEARPGPGSAPWWRGRRALVLGLAASLVAAAALGGVAAWQHSEAEDARARAAEIERSGDVSAAVLAGVLTAPDATVHTGRLDDGAAVAVVVSRSEGRAAFAAEELPALTGGRVYELWYAEPAGDLRPAGLLAGSGDHPARVLEGRLGDAVAVGITVEPAGGSPQPTTRPLGLVPIGT
ncbi:anti-sigma factor [Streptomyces sp. NPDC005805]|uniref:anti-sigma factor n=1 Tax=Streptomyces sp. NPDC005805 TaxID=3157068 RepID=UPI0033D8A439